MILRLQMQQLEQLGTTAQLLLNSQRLSISTAKAALPKPTTALSSRLACTTIFWGSIEPLLASAPTTVDFFGIYEINNHLPTGPKGMETDCARIGKTAFGMVFVPKCFRSPNASVPKEIRDTA